MNGRSALRWLRWPFWNDAERRLRALWRIAGFLALAGLFTWILSAVIGRPRGSLSEASAAALLFAARAAVTTTLAAVVAVRLLDRRRVRELGIVPVPGWWGDLAFGLVLGAALMTAIFLVEYAAGWVRIEGLRTVRNPEHSFGTVLLGMAFVSLCVGFYEELVSRGYLLRAMAQGMRFAGMRAALVLGTLISSVLFALGHFNNPNASVVSTANIVLAGVMLAVPFVLTGRLAASIGLHITWNFFQSGIYGFPTSGLAAPASLVGIAQGGPDAWTGGAFGPEAGILGLLAMLLGIAAFVGREKLRTGRVAACAALVEPVLPPVSLPATTAGPEASPEAPAS